MTRASSPCPAEPEGRRGEGDAPLFISEYKPLPPEEPSRIMVAWGPILARRNGVGPRAIARRDWWTAWLTGDLGLFPPGTLDLPVPRITDEEYEARTAGTFAVHPDDPATHRGPQSLILHLPNDLHAPHVKKKSQRSSPSLAYDRFMAAVGQQDHWTVTDAANRKNIRWEPVPTPTWRWMETADPCPRTHTSWNNLAVLLPGTPAVPGRMPSLEEYVAAWHATKHEYARMFDVSTWCLLRTRFGPSGSGALSVRESGGRVLVPRWDAAALGVAYSGCGSRASDPVE